MRFAGFSVTGGRNRDDRTIYLDSLCVFTEALPALRFEPRPARGIDMFPGQSAGTNTGPGRLPFPTRPETILPETLVADYRVDLSDSADGAYLFRCRGSDGTLVYRVESERTAFGVRRTRRCAGGMAATLGLRTQSVWDAKTLLVRWL